jgi:hypothetical protein
MHAICMQIAGVILCPHCESYNKHEIAKQNRNAICMQIAYEIARVNGPLGRRQTH